MPEKTYRDALKEAMRQEMERDESVILMGEDIGVYGGTQLVTDGLIDIFGPKRVVDTPIAENGFTGAAVGMAMTGLRPVVEMMTWNFSFLAADAIIQHAAKVRYFSGGQVEVPLVIRGPNGGSVQLSAQHTHSLENFYAAFPGLKVISPVTPYDVKGMMLGAIRDPNAVIFLEAGALYGTKGEVPDDEYTVPFGEARIAREGDDVTLISYGRQVNLCMRVADKLEEEDDISAEVIDLRSLRPFDEETIIESVRKTSRAIVIDEGHQSFGVTAEIAARIAEKAFYHLDAPVQRMGAMDVPIPFSPALEDLTVPTPDGVADRARRVLKGEI